MEAQVCSSDELTARNVSAELVRSLKQRAAGAWRSAEAGAEHGVSSDAKGGFRLWDVAAERCRLVEPFGDGVLYIPGSGLSRVAIRHAAGKIGDRRQKPTAVLFGQRLDQNGIIRFSH